METKPDRSIFLYFRDWEDTLVADLRSSATPPIDHIEEFIEQAVAASPRITCIEDRHDLRRSLRYWASILTLQGAPYPDIDIDKDILKPEILLTRGIKLPQTKDGCRFEILYAGPGLGKETIKSCFQEYDTTRLMSIRKLIDKACRAYGSVPYGQSDVSVDENDVIYVTIFAPDMGSTRCIGIIKVLPKEKK